MKNFKLLLLAILVVCTACVLTVMAGATETEGETPTVLGEGYVQKYITYDAENPDTGLNTGSKADGHNNLYWTVTSDGVLTITNKLDEEGEKASTTLTLNPALDWNKMNLVPWYAHRNAVTKVVVEAPVTKIAGYAFNQLGQCTTVVLPKTIIDISGSMTFSNMAALTTLGREGTPEGIIDLRYFTGTSSQCFEASCAGKTVTVLLPYYYDAPISTAKIFANNAVVKFRVMPGSKGETFADKCIANSTSEAYRAGNNALPYSTNITKEYYADVETTITMGVKSNYANFDWTLDIANKTLSIYPVNGGYQFEDANRTWQDFKKGWNDYIETITVSGFGKLYLSGTSGDWTPGFSGLTALKSIQFGGNQRIQNSAYTKGGLFTGCTNLTSVAFGSTPVEGVVDLSGATCLAGQDQTETWLANQVSNCPAVKKIILPTAASCTKLFASTIAGCTGLEEIVIDANITEIEEGTFAPWTNSEEGYSALKATFVQVDSPIGTALESAGLLTVVAPKTEMIVGGQVDQKEGEGDTNDLVWSYDRVTKVLTISGTSTSIVWVDGKTSGWNGTLNKTDVSMIPWMADYASEIEKIIIEAPITTTPKAIFYKNHALKSVTFPAETVSLGDMAFADCKALVELKTAGAGSPDNVIDLRNFTGTVNWQVFETAPANGATLWLPRTGSFNLNNVFGRTGNSYNFVVYPGSVGETSVYNMINSRAARVYGTFDYTYYTEEQASEWYAEYMATTSCSYTGQYGSINHEFDIETGIVTVTGSGADANMNQSGWITMLSTWKYAIKRVDILHTGKTTWNANGSLKNLPELTTIILNATRQQGPPVFSGNKKLTTLGTTSNIVKGVINLEKWNDMDNSGLAGTIGSSMFANNPSITTVVLPGNSHSSWTITTIGANAFQNCTGLVTIRIPENCSITSVDPTAFAGTGPVVIYNEMADDTLAKAILAILPEGSYIYEEPASSDVTLERSVVFDGWKVRTSIKNGLRGVFFADNAKIATNEEAGWTLVEYGSILSTTANKNALGAKVYYDKTENAVTFDSHLRAFPIYSVASNIDTDPEKTVLGRELGTKLKGADVENAANTYFAVSVVNYKANYTTEVYMAGYEVWKDADGNVVIMYTDYATDTAHDATLKDASIYEVSMRMYMEGFINDKKDPDDIVWNTLVAGGAVTLKKDTDYVVTDTKLGEGVEMKDLDGNAFGDTFALVKIPQVTCQVSSGVLTGFTNSKTALSIFNSPYTSGKYVLVHSSIGGTTSASTSASWDNGTAGQLQSNWFSGSKVTSVSAANFPNPIIKSNVWGSIERVVFDTGITTLGAMPYRGCPATTYVYSEDLTKFASQSFENTSAIKTMYRAGYPVSEGTVDLHWLTSIHGTYTFDGANYVVEYWLPANAKPSTEFFKANKALTTVWFGGGYDENGKPENRVEGVIDFTGATAMTGLGANLFAECTSTIQTIRLSDAITSISAAVFANGSTTGVTFQQPTYKETIAAFCQTNGFTYQNLVDGVWTTVEPVELEESEGWSGIIVK